MASDLHSAPPPSSFERCWASYGWTLLVGVSMLHAETCLRAVRRIRAMEGLREMEVSPVYKNYLTAIWGKWRPNRRVAKQDGEIIWEATVRAVPGANLIYTTVVGVPTGLYGWRCQSKVEAFDKFQKGDLKQVRTS